MTRKKSTGTTRRKKTSPRCDRCKKEACSDGEDCFEVGEEMLKQYREDPELQRVARAAAEVEAEHYGMATRLEEVVHFARKADVTHLGLAFCSGFREEARMAGEMLRTFFKVTSVCCKGGGIPKSALSLPRVRPEEAECMCNPLGQATLLNRAGTGLNVMLGLCVGHDALFNRYSEALVTTLVVKDRVLGHNPVAALNCTYVNRRLREGLFAR